MERGAHICVAACNSREKTILIIKLILYAWTRNSSIFLMDYNESFKHLTRGCHLPCLDCDGYFKIHLTGKSWLMQFSIFP